VNQQRKQRQHRNSGVALENISMSGGEGKASASENGMAKSG